MVLSITAAAFWLLADTKIPTALRVEKNLVVRPALSPLPLISASPILMSDG
jgi:hypothetical protein